MNRRDLEQRIVRSIESSIETKTRMLQGTELLAAIAEVSATLVAVYQRGNKLFLFGNGGSAADAQHIAAEFVGRFAFDRPALPALALSVNTSSLTAIGNDYGFDQVFSRQLEALAKPGDAVVGISTSGNSPNVLRALRTARKLGLHTFALTGVTGGKIKPEVDLCLCAPSDDTPRIQECHILIGHAISEIVEAALFQEGKPQGPRVMNGATAL